MKEQTQRKDTTTTHISECKMKLKILCQQQKDLVKAVKNLINECINDKKQIKLYYSFKMYNDPELNPQLYKK